MTKISISLVLLCLLMISCVKKEKVFLRSYVTYYVGVEEITLQKSSLTDNYFSIRYKGDFLGGYDSTGHLKESYDELCRKNNDMTYNKEVTLIIGDEDYKAHCLGTDFIMLNLISDSDFDNAHPAGTSLADITLFKGQTLKPFIDSGYTLSCSHPKDRQCATPVECLFSELTTDQLKMLGGYTYPSLGGFSFLSVPTISKIHTFTLSMTTDDGRVFEASIDMEFE